MPNHNRPNVSPTDDIAGQLKQINYRLASLERVASSGTGGDSLIHGGTADGRIKITGGGDVSLDDDTGHLQIGASGGSNIGIDANEIQVRDGAGGPGILYFNIDGSTTRFGGPVQLLQDGASADSMPLEFANYPGLGFYTAGLGGNIEGQPEIRMRGPDATIFRFFAEPARDQSVLTAIRDNLVLATGYGSGGPTGMTLTLTPGQDRFKGTHGGGSELFEFTPTRAQIPGVFGQQTTGARVVVSGSAGLLARESSSLENKDGLEPIDDPVDKLMALQPIYFRSKLPLDEGRSFYGFGAEHVAAVDRRFAVYDPDERGDDGESVPVADRSPISLDDRALLATAVAAMQAQQEQIDRLEAQVERLTERVDVCCGDS